MNVFQRVVIEPFERFYEKVLQFLPNILTSIFLIIAGVTIGAILRIVFLRFLRAINFDKLTERFGMIEVLRKSGIKEPISVLLSKMVGWITILIFITISLQALDIPAVERILERFFLYLPNVFVAAFILFFGYLLSNFFGRAALIASVNAGIKVSGLIGKLVKLTIFLLAVTMTLEQLGIGRGTIVIAFSIIIGGIVLALAIAFGLGGRDIAKEYLEKKLKGEEKKEEISHL